MTRRRKDPLRPLTQEERETLEQIARASSEPASHVARAKALLAVAKGKTYGAAAQAAGRRSNDAVSQLVSRFNQEGMAAVEPRHGGGPGGSSMEQLSKPAFWPKSDENRRWPRTGRRRGR